MIRRAFLFALLFAVGVFAVRGGAAFASGVGSWSNNGPEGVSNPSLVFDPMKASVAYLRAGLDLYKTVNAGETWTRILAHGGRPAVAPSNPSILFASAFPDLARSEDGGKTWTMLPAPKPPERAGLSNYQIVFDASDPNVVFLAQNIRYNLYVYEGVVYKSTDGGQTWAALMRRQYFNPNLVADSNGMWVFWLSAAGFPANLTLDRIPGDGSSPRTLAVPFGVRSLAVDPSNPSNLYYGAAEGLVRSRDGGTSWTLITLPGPVSIIQINPANPSEIVGSDGDGLIRSTDYGSTWSPFSLGPVAFLAFDPFDASTLYGTIGSQLVRTANRGAEWKPIVKGVVSTSVSAIAAENGRPERLYAAVGAEVFRTDDSGDSWSLLGSVPGVQTIGALAFNPASALLLAGTSPKGLVASPDQGRNWSALGFGVFFIAVAPSNPRIVYSGGVGQGDPLYRSADGGFTFTHLLGFEPVSVAVDPRNPDLLYANGFTKSEAGLFKSTDGGSSWSLLRDSGESPVVDPHDPSKLYVGGGNGLSGLYRSLDAGISWEPTGAFSLIGSLVVHPSIPGLLFLYDYQGQIFFTTDSGASWNPFPTPSDLGGTSTLAVDSGGKTLHVTSASSGVYSYRFIEARATISPRVPPRPDRFVPFRP